MLTFEISAKPQGFWRNTQSIKSKFYYYHVPYKKLSELRSELTHEYFSSDPTAMWNMAVNVLPYLKPQFKKILEEL
jgi:uncharacterized protein with HEPN domain